MCFCSLGPVSIVKLSLTVRVNHLVEGASWSFEDSESSLMGCRGHCSFYFTVSVNRGGHLGELL